MVYHLKTSNTGDENGLIVMSEQSSMSVPAESTENLRLSGMFGKIINICSDFHRYGGCKQVISVYA